MGRRTLSFGDRAQNLIDCFKYTKSDHTPNVTKFFHNVLRNLVRSQNVLHMVKYDINTIPLLTLKHLQSYNQLKYTKFYLEKSIYMINYNF